jgi:hypothetical protein
MSATSPVVLGTSPLHEAGPLRRPLPLPLHMLRIRIPRSDVSISSRLLELCDEEVGNACCPRRP